MVAHPTVVRWWECPIAKPKQAPSAGIGGTQKARTPHRASPPTFKRTPTGAMMPLPDLSNLPCDTPELITLRQAVLWVGLDLQPVPYSMEPVYGHPTTVTSREAFANETDWENVEKAKRFIYWSIKQGNIKLSGEEEFECYKSLNSGDQYKAERTIFIHDNFAIESIDWDSGRIEYSEYDGDMFLCDSKFIRILLNFSELAESTYFLQNDKKIACESSLDCQITPLTNPSAATYTTRLLGVVDALRAQISVDPKPSSWTRDSIMNSSRAMIPGLSDRDAGAIATILLPDSKRGK
jgi:hypothetical protein